MTYAGLTLTQAGDLVQKHFHPRGLARRMSRLWTRVLDGLLVEDAPAAPEIERPALSRDGAGDRAFFDRQVHIAMEHYGRLDPLDLDECLAHDGFAALARCLGVKSPKSEVRSPKREVQSPKCDALSARSDHHDHGAVRLARSRGRRVSHRPEMAHGSASSPPKPNT